MRKVRGCFPRHPWSSGYDVSPTCRRSPVRSWLGVLLPSLLAQQAPATRRCACVIGLYSSKNASCQRSRRFLCSLANREPVALIPSACSRTLRHGPIGRTMATAGAGSRRGATAYQGREQVFDVHLRAGVAAHSAATLWPSGLRRWLKVPFRKGVGSNPTGVIFAQTHPRCASDPHTHR